MAAHVAVATGVKAAAGSAIAKTVEAVKAKKAAAVAVVTAPLRVAAKTVALKVGAVKAVGAAKAAHVGAVVHQLRAHPIVVPVPVPVAVPFKPAVVQHPVPVVVKPVVSVVPVAPLSVGSSLIGAVHGKVGHALNAIHHLGH